MLTRDMRKASEARQILMLFSIEDLIAKVGKAADLFETQTLPLGNGTQTPDEFVMHQSASTGLPEHMCRSNMQKNCFVMRNMTDLRVFDSRIADGHFVSRLRYRTPRRGG